MRFFSIIWFAVFILTLPFISKGQQTIIEYRNDSLFINRVYIKENQSKVFFDSLLSSRSKVTRHKDQFSDVKSGKKRKLTTYLYKDLGLYINKYDSDTTRTTVGIKLYRDVDKKYDRANIIDKPFSGTLIIAGNYINDKRTDIQLSQLINCHVTYSWIQCGLSNALIGGDIVYKRNMIRLSFDHDTKELTHVFIFHNHSNK